MRQEVTLEGRLAPNKGRFVIDSRAAGFVRRLFREKPLGAFGGVIVVALLLIAIFADVITPYRYDQPDFSAMMVAPGEAHVLGTDYLGRDMLSRIVYGGRVSMGVAAGAVTFATLITLLLGVTSGWYGGIVDTIIQRVVVNTWIALPFLLILLTLSSILGPGPFGVTTIVIILSLGGISDSRVVRGTILSLKTTAFVEAAQAMGATSPRIMLQHIVPNTFAPVIILSTIRFGNVILAESTLSFLGFGVKPPFPTWGQMLSGQSLSHFYEGPWTMVWPGLILTLAVFGFNVFGDALRDMLDPRLRGSR